MPLQPRLVVCLLMTASLAAGCALPGTADVTPEVDVSGTDESDGDAGPLTFTPLWQDFARPLAVVPHAASAGWFVLEQGGVLWHLDAATGARTVALDLSDVVAGDFEQGLLSLAFDPAAPDEAYVTYTDAADDALVLARYQWDAGTQSLGAATQVLRVAQPYANHNGGHITFGPDGMLYLGLGDGGNAGDPKGNGQDPHTLLGALLRLDVSAQESYRVPDDNPYADGADGAPEVWLTGVRNPWRFSFDRLTGDLYVGDVGQNRWEEVTFLAAGEQAGANLGWNVFEGASRYKLVGATWGGRLVDPAVTYEHENGRCSVTGGHALRGDAYPDAWQGVYVLGDFCSGDVWLTRQNADDSWPLLRAADTDFMISSFAQDDDGRVLVIDHGGGAIYALGVGALPAALA